MTGTGPVHLIKLYQLHKEDDPFNQQSITCIGWRKTALIYKRSTKNGSEGLTAALPHAQAHVSENYCWLLASKNNLALPKRNSQVRYHGVALSKTSQLWLKKNNWNLNLKHARNTSNIHEKPTFQTDEFTRTSDDGSQKEKWRHSLVDNLFKWWNICIISLFAYQIKKSLFNSNQAKLAVWFSG